MAALTPVFFVSLCAASSAGLLWAERVDSARLRWVFKPLASLAFVLAGVSAGAMETPIGTAILTGLVLSAIGDVLPIPRQERLFLAEILYGFITRNYRLVAERHFDIGYVPGDQSVDDFALAIRSIGEPLHGRTASDISMARVLGQLFAVTDLFSMQTRPELVLLQKSMVLVEGVARALDPDLDIWTVAEPVVGDWLRQEAGPLGRIEEIKDHFKVIAEAAGRLPVIAAQAELALADYHAGKMAPRQDGLMRGALLGLIGVASLVMVTLLYRLLTLPSW